MFSRSLWLTPSLWNTNSGGITNSKMLVRTRRGQFPLHAILTWRVSIALNSVYYQPCAFIAEFSTIYFRALHKVQDNCGLNLFCVRGVLARSGFAETGVAVKLI